eukprot:179857-Rhodomonas_salina.1
MAAGCCPDYGPLALALCSSCRQPRFGCGLECDGLRVSPASCPSGSTSSAQPYGATWFGCLAAAGSRLERVRLCHRASQKAFCVCLPTSGLDSEIIMMWTQASVSNCRFDTWTP